MLKRHNYVTFSIPSDLVNEIEDVIKTSKKGYKTQTEFLKEAIREKLDKEKLYSPKSGSRTFF